MKALFFVLLLFSFHAYSDPKLAVHLLSYLAQDYGEAVQEGKVHSQSEYEEQLQFAAEVTRISKEENFPANVQNSIAELNKLIENKRDPLEVAEVANKTKWELIRIYSIATSPTQAPDYKLGKELYQNQCVKCHGQAGYGDGPEGVGLDPAPANFHDKMRMSSISPFQVYTTITLGVPGTGMLSFAHLSDHERWSLASYVSYFHLEDANKVETDIKIPPEELASMSDYELLEKYHKGEGNQEEFLAAVRSPYAATDNSASYFREKAAHALKKFEKSRDLYAQGDTGQAMKLALEAYLEGVEPIEPLLTAGSLKEIEGAYSKYLSLIKSAASVESVNQQNNHIQQLLKKEELSVQEVSSTKSMLLAFGIVFREALEAILVLILLLSILKKLDVPRAIRWVHLGWISALVAGFGIYFIIQEALLRNMGIVEKIEGYVGLMAVGLLLYVGLWFHGKSNIEQWKTFLKDQIHGKISNGNMLGIAAISFMAVFREVVETIVFIKVLQLDGHPASSLVQGIVLAAILTVIIGFLMMRFSTRFNIGRMIRVSTFLILTYAVMLMGKAVHALQLSGVIGTTAIADFSFPAIGLFDTVETLGAQVLLLLVIVIVFYLERKKADLQ